MIYTADIFYQPALSLITPHWHGTYDQDRPLAEKSRCTLADRIVADKIMVSGYHFPWPRAGVMVKDGLIRAYALTGVAITAIAVWRQSPSQTIGRPRCVSSEWPRCS